jgi:DNA-binding PadR family transcriptional regulator
LIQLMLLTFPAILPGCDLRVGKQAVVYLLQIYLLQIYTVGMANRIALHPPLSPAVFAILLSLAECSKHGYQIMKDARTPDGGGLNLGPGTLYGSLDRMMRDKLVEESGVSDDERRRYYRLTATGHAVLSAELERLDAAVKSARTQGLIPEGGRS